MSQAMSLLVFPTNDLDAAKAFYGALLGTEPYVDGSYYVGFRTGDMEIGLDPNGHDKGTGGPIAYWSVADLEGAVEKMMAAGATLRQPISEVGGGLRIALLTDKENNTIGLRQSR